MQAVSVAVRTVVSAAVAFTVAVHSAVRVLRAFAVAASVRSLVRAVVSAASFSFCVFVKMGGKLVCQLAEFFGLLVRKAGGETVEGLCPYFCYPAYLSLAELGKEDPVYALVGLVRLLFYKASGCHPVGKLGYGGGAHVQKFAEFACAEPVVSGDHH